MKKTLPQFWLFMPKKQLLLFACCLFMALSGVNGQTTFSAGSLPAAIPDPGNLSRTITVSGLGGTVATADEVQINVAISHAWASDIVIGITPPGGTEIIIVNRIGGAMNIDMSAANVLSFRSNAAAVVTVPGLNGVIPAGVYLPSGANAVGSFSSLVGATRDGDWTIRVRDDDAIIQGSLESASISFFSAAATCPDPPTASVSTQPTCVTPTGTITVTAPANGAGVTYTLTGISPAVAASTNATGVFSGLASGTYEVVSIVDGCTSPAATLVVNPAPSATTYYADVDQDGFGDPANSTQACSQPGGYVTNNTDCNDNNSLEKPGQIWYKDTDNDGYAQTGAVSVSQCTRPAGYKVLAELASITGDCNDNNSAIKPGATEVCDGVDNNCNGSTDEGVIITYYRDMDGDTYGNPLVATQACSQPSGYVTNSNDCNDNSAIEKPGQVWYKDTDNDGYAQTGAATITQCLRPSGYKALSELVSTTGDCNDTNAAVKPGATEVCDGLDNNCNGQIDEPSAISSPWSSSNVGTGSNGAATTGCATGNQTTYNLSAQGFSTPTGEIGQIVYQQLCGTSLSITARVSSLSVGGWAGITMRESNASGSKMVTLKTQLGNTGIREARSATNGVKNTQIFPATLLHEWLRITRSGNTFQYFISPDGTNWQLVGSVNIMMSSCLNVGMFVESINVNTTTQASFTNVTVTGGAPGLASADNDGVAIQQKTVLPDVQLFPNPSTGEVNLTMPQMLMGQSVRIQVYNSLGELVLSKETGEVFMEVQTLDLSSMIEGVYYLQVNAAGFEPVTKRVVLARK